MPSFWEIVQEALIAYWSSPLSLAVLVASGSAIATLGYVFLANARNAKLRVSLLTAMYALSIFFWAFIAISLVLCISQSRMVAYSRQGVPIAVGGALLGGLGASFVLSVAIWRYGNRAVLRRFAPRPTREGEHWIQEYVTLLSEFEGTNGTRIGVVDDAGALAMAVGGKPPYVLVSRGLLDLLEKDEMETVLAHEVMHLKHHDAQFKVFSRIFSRILFFDPFSKFFDPAVHREREYLADEMGARSTRRPASLASALLKIANTGMPTKPAWGLSILGPSRGVFSRYPPLKERVRRLVVLSELLRPPDNPDAHGPG